MGSGRRPAYWLLCGLPADVGGLDKLHWDESAGEYRDWGLHTEGVRLQRHTFNVGGQQQVGIQALYLA